MKNVREGLVTLYIGSVTSVGRAEVKRKDLHAGPRKPLGLYSRLCLRTLWGPFSFFFFFCVLMFWVLGFCDDGQGPMANGFSRAYLEGLGDMDLGYGGWNANIYTWIWVNCENTLHSFNSFFYNYGGKPGTLFWSLYFEITINLVYTF